MQKTLPLFVSMMKEIFGTQRFPKNSLYPVRLQNVVTHIRSANFPLR